MTASAGEPEWLHGHPHEPNLVTPAGDGSFLLVTPAGEELISPTALRTLPQTTITQCMIVSTGHGASGPFSFAGIPLAEVVEASMARANSRYAWESVDVIGADGFGARLTRGEMDSAPADRPVLLALTLDGSPLQRAAGLVRLIVPAEVHDALKQIKWVARIVLT